MFKKIASLVLMICVLSTVFPIMHYEVQAADYTYDATKALEYAKKNWNSKTMKCAEFVTRTVKAGGLDIAIKTGTGSAYREIGNAIGVYLGTNKNPDEENNKDLPNISTLTLNSNGYPTKADNEDILKAGDVVIQWCFSDHIAPHILICSGYNDKGIATFYATNNGLNNGTYNFKKNSQHKSTCKIGAKVIQFNISTDKKETTEKAKTLDYPKNINVKKTGDRTALVSWEEIAGATHYEVEYKSPNTKNVWKKDGDYKTNTKTSYTVKQLGNYTYHFRVRALNTNGESHWSEVIYTHYRD